MLLNFQEDDNNEGKKLVIGLRNLAWPGTHRNGPGKGGVDDEVLSDTQYGIAASYSLFDSTTLAIEYLQSVFENDDDVSAITAQLAIEF